jgi:hypothetical protein
MSYLKRFWYNVKNSFYNPEFYARLKDKRFSRTILVLAGVLAINMLIITIFLGTTAGLFLKSFSAEDFTNQYYPEGLELTARDDQFSSNVTEPYFIPLQIDEKHESEVVNAVVIDTSEDLTLDQIRSYNSAVVIIKDGVVVKKDNGEQTLTLKEANLGDFVINEENSTYWISKAASFAYRAYIPFLLFVLVFGTLFLLLWQMFVLVFAALVVKIIAAIKKVSLAYGYAYRIALFASLPVIILNIILNPFFNIPALVDFLLFIALVSFNLKNTDMPKPATPVTEVTN